MRRARLTILLGLILSTFACESFLDKEPLGVITEGVFPSTEDDAILAINGAYNMLREWRFHVGFPIFDIMSDDASKGSNPGDAIQIAAFDDFSFQPEENTIANYYGTLYQAVRRANTVIERVPNIDMEANLRDRLVAEARFIRALTYFRLVKSFGAVPLITTTSPEFKVPRTSASEIYDQVILPDLEFAAVTLPEKSDYANSELGRATRGAAKALLARAYLFLGDFAQVEQYALEVINSGEYQLDSDFLGMFRPQGEHGPGSVFEISAIAGVGFQEGGAQYGNTQGTRGTPNKGWGFNRPSYDLISTFETDDPRLDATVIFLGEVLDGVTIFGDPATPDTTFVSGTNQIDEIEVYNEKVWVPGTSPLDSWGHNIRIVRYADVLLMAAEALNENGKASEALVYINQVRARARQDNAAILPDITTEDQTTLRTIIWQERRCELAMEGIRFYDLIRTDRANTVLGPKGFIEGKHELLPIPQSEIDLSEGTLDQNPNW